MGGHSGSIPGGAEGAFFAALHASLGALRGTPTLLFSGGVDSSLLAFCLRELGVPARHLAVGVGKAPDLEAARTAGERLGVPVELRPVAIGGVAAVLRESAVVEPTEREPRRSVRLALELAMREAGPGDLICGQGADELFGGYARYRGRSEVEADRLRAADLARLRADDWPWTIARASAHGIRIRAPYLDDAVLTAALGVPWPEGGLGPLGKEGFRRIAREHGLPPELAERPKRALQYGSRVRRSVDELATRRRLGEPL